MTLVAHCTICNGRQSREELHESYRTFAAQYEGQCAGCNLPITVGQIIAWKPDARAHHERCAP